MTIDDKTVESLRRIFASGGDDRSAEGPCPATEQIWAAAHGELNPKETREIVKHMRICATCAAEWRTTIEPEDAGESRVFQEPARRTPRRSLWLPAAAAAILAVGLGWVLLFQRSGSGPQAPAFRSEDVVEILSLVPENEILPRGRFLLVWSPVEEGAAYTVKVDRRDLTPVTVERNLSGSEYLVPVEMLEEIPSGDVMVWRVEAHLVDGRRVSSPAFLVRLE